MFLNPFDGPRAKIARSKKHFDELVAAQSSFGKEQPLEIEIEALPGGGGVVYARIKAIPDLETAAIVADIVGNFRSSLDLAVCAACRVKGATNLKKTYFAFSGDEKQWDCYAAKNNMVAADDTIRSVVRSFKPWEKDGNSLLYALSKISAADKHVDLVPIGAKSGHMTIEGLSTKSTDGKAVKFMGRIPSWTYENGREELFRTGPNSNIEITGPSVVKTSLGFGNVYALAGQPVIPTLNQMGAMCEKIIDTIETSVK